MTTPLYGIVEKMVKGYHAYKDMNCHAGGSKAVCLGVLATISIQLLFQFPCLLLYRVVSHISYRMLLNLNQHGQQTWLARVKNLLQDAGLKYIWQNPWDVYPPEARG